MVTKDETFQLITSSVPVSVQASVKGEKQGPSEMFAAY